MATRDPKYLGMIVRSVESIRDCDRHEEEERAREQRFAAMTPGQRKAYEILNGGPTRSVYGAESRVKSVGSMSLPDSVDSVPKASRQITHDIMVGQQSESSQGDSACDRLEKSQRPQPTPGTEV